MTTNEEKPASFKNPPVVETVLGVQFAQIHKLTGAHVGWYWRTVLGGDWVAAVEAPYLQDQYERFGQQSGWSFPPLPLVASLSNRLQIVHRDDDRVIQVQNTRFLHNWRKRAEAYPRFKKLYEKFIQEYQAFVGFLVDAQLGDLIPNQWEVTYINHIPRGVLWDSPADWHKVFPRVVPDLAGRDATRPESLSVDLHYELVPELGRLHVSCKHGKLQEDGSELLALELTARGPVKDGDPVALERGLQLGHRSIVRTFVSLASNLALESWGIE